jgi:hypothetical protein
MKHFFDLTFRPFFVVTGVATTLASLNAFWPRWAVERVEKIKFIQDYTMIVQHWGIMVGLMGIFILIYSALEKAFIVYLVVANASRSYSEGFRLGAGVDGTVVLYIIAYFGVTGWKTNSLSAPDPAGVARA